MHKVSIKIPNRVISKKNSRRLFSKNGKIINIPSGAYAKYKDNALVVLAELPIDLMQPPYQINYLFEMKGKMSTDVDNMMASINDILQDAGIIDDDKHIVRGTFELTFGHQDFNTYIDIASLTNLINNSLSEK